MVSGRWRNWQDARRQAPDHHTVLVGFIASDKRGPSNQNWLELEEFCAGQLRLGSQSRRPHTGTLNARQTVAQIPPHPVSQTGQSRHDLRMLTSDIVLLSRIRLQVKQRQWELFDPAAMAAGVVQCSLQTDSIGVTPGQKSGAAGRTDRLRHIEIGKTGSCRREAVKVRGRIGSTLAVQVSIAQIICYDHDNIRRIIGGERERACDQQQQDKPGNRGHAGPQVW
jgi:hypothetical protein